MYAEWHSGETITPKRCVKSGLKGAFHTLSRSSGSAINCKQNTNKILDRQTAETGEIHQNKLCNMQEIGQEIARANHGKTPD